MPACTHCEYTNDLKAVAKIRRINPKFWEMAKNAPDLTISMLAMPAYTSAIVDIKRYKEGRQFATIGSSQQILDNSTEEGGP